MTKGKRVTIDKLRPGDEVVAPLSSGGYGIRTIKQTLEGYIMVFEGNYVNEMLHTGETITVLNR